MNYDEIWGIAYPRIMEYFASQPDVEKAEDGSFRYGEAVIQPKPLPEKRMGSFVMAQTRVIITGGVDADEIHHRFYMRFLSAGG